MHDHVGGCVGAWRAGVGGHVGHRQQNEVAAEDLVVAAEGLAAVAVECKVRTESHRIISLDTRRVWSGFTDCLLRANSSGPSVLPVTTREIRAMRTAQTGSGCVSTLLGVADTVGVATRMVRGPIPEPVSAELVRSGLVERLERRFASPVTTVIAGAGFGKSTVIAQAARRNVVAPLGIDAWVSCGQGHENADQLTRSILTALETDREPGLPPVDAVVRAIVARSPLDVCVILDDCHMIPHGSSSEQMLSHVLRHLPNNGHLLLSGRRLPEVPLARLKAAGRFIVFGANDLSFTPAEVEAASNLLGCEAERAHDLGGWPALVRLALVAPTGVDREFLREEVVADLPPALRRALVALVVLGPATEQEVREVTEESVSLATLADRLPLISATSDGRYTAHQLWDNAALATLSAEELTALRQRCARRAAASG